MAIEWLTRVERRVTFAGICREINGCLSTLLGIDRVDLAVWLPGPQGRVRAVDDMPEMQYQLLPRGYDDEARSVVLEIPELKATATLMARGVGDPDESPEYGNFITSSPARTRASVVVGIGAVIGAARSCGGAVVDEARNFLGDRFADPDDLLQRLAAAAAHISAEDAVDEILSRTTFTHYLTDS